MTLTETLLLCRRCSREDGNVESVGGSANGWKGGAREKDGKEEADQ